MKKTVIIILNWNGADDTIACLNSLLQLRGNFRVLVVDNGSGDDSVERIGQWIALHENSIVAELLPLDKNYGFAVGNNKGIAYARKYSPDYCLLLNNDTEVEPDFLTKLLEFSARNPEYSVLTPKIFYYFDKKKIWNCGGKLFMGFRKYYYAGESDSAIKEKEYIPISFVTGCALFFPSELIDADGRLFTERFFFGEEDFEFSMRMNAQGVKIACVLDSVIYHKVGVSTSKLSGVGKLYLHYLNRFIDIRINKSLLFYILWVLLNMPLCIRHFYKALHSLPVSFKMFFSLLSDAGSKQGVSYADFEALIINKNYFNR